MGFAHQFVIPWSEKGDCGDLVPIVLSPHVGFRRKHKKFFSLRSSDRFAKRFIFARAFSTDQNRKASQNNQNQNERTVRHSWQETPTESLKGDLRLETRKWSVSRGFKLFPRRRRSKKYEDDLKLNVSYKCPLLWNSQCENFSRERFPFAWKFHCCKRHLRNYRCLGASMHEEVSVFSFSYGLLNTTEKKKKNGVRTHWKSKWFRTVYTDNI